MWQYLHLLDPTLLLHGFVIEHSLIGNILHREPRKYYLIYWEKESNTTSRLLELRSLAPFDPSVIVPRYYDTFLRDQTF
jgi:hypothetical protein